jgi:soluble lytic murein transglycosylase-like protein
MEALLLRLQAEIAARKHPRRDLLPLVKRGAVAFLALGFAYELGIRSVDPGAGMLARIESRNRFAALYSSLETERGELAIQRAKVERLETALERSAQYRIPADLAMAIEDIALAEGIEPHLAFEIVRVESNFNPNAVSPAGALGLAQVMPATAEIYRPGITREQLFDRDTNLRIGFRFFRYLLTIYDGDVRIALQAYNRGPTRVNRMLAAGEDPGFGYAGMVLGVDAISALRPLTAGPGQSD